MAQQGKTLLPGVEIMAIDANTGQSAGFAVSDEEGNFVLAGLPPGSYQLRALLPGFSELLEGPFQLSAGQELEISLNLEVEQISQDIEVVARRDRPETETATSEQMVRGEMIDVAPVKGEDFRDLLPLIPGVLRSADGRLSIKGGSPTQNNLLINGANVTDPTTSNFGATLPADAIDSVDLFPNPYATEFGRFSSGVVQIQTTQGNNKWHFTGNNFAPKLKRRLGPVMGIEKWTPRIGFRGPLVRDKLFISQSFNYRFARSLVRSTRIPELEGDTQLESFLSFTQFDVNLNENHRLRATFSVFPQKLAYVNLDSFNPQEVTPNLTQRGLNIALSETWTVSPSSVLETVVSFSNFDVDIFGQGLKDMNLAPETNSGNFFNTQRRDTGTLQFRESLSHFYEGWGGEHVFKVGLDVLRSTFDGSSQSRDVNVLRNDGSLVEKIEFGGPSAQRERSTDYALFFQDRWRVNQRLLLEPGIRLDRDGSLNNFNFSPRFGFVFSILPEGKGVLRGGAGLFYDRTSLNVKAFETFEDRFVLRFGEDGVAPASDPIHFRHRSAQAMETPYSFTWNIEYDHRLTENLLFKTNFFRRMGFHEFLIDPIETSEGHFLRLDSRGRSRYWELEFTTRYDFDERHHLILSYVRSRARQDLNAFDDFFGNFRNPIIRENQFSLSNTDAPNRFLAWGNIPFIAKWSVAPLLEIRNGFPYSTINESRDFIGERNRAGRFRTFATLDLKFQRFIKIMGVRARVGFRIFNVTNSFNARDIQNNIHAPSIGTTFNSPGRAFGGTFQIVQ